MSKTKSWFSSLANSSRLINRSTRDVVRHNQPPSIRKQQTVECVHDLCDVFLIWPDHRMNHLTQKLKQHVIGSPAEPKSCIGEDPVIVPVVVIHSVLPDVLSCCPEPPVSR